MTMHVGALSIEIHINHSRSLKDKRQVVRSVLDGARARFAVAAAEVDHQDTWQRAGLGFAAIGGSAGHVGEVLDAVERFVWSFPELEVVLVDRQWLDADA